MNNPNQETEAARIYKRRRLRTVAENILKKRGQIILPEPVAMTMADLRFKDGRSGQLLRIAGKIATQRVDAVIINVLKGNDTSDPLTTYTSLSPGEFTRSDTNLGDSGVPSLEELTPLSPEEKGVRLFAGSVAAGTSKMINKLQGVDDHPITGVEADEIRLMLRGASAA